MSVAGRAGLWFLYASGAVFLALELLSLAGVPWSRATVLPAVLILAAGAAFLPLPPRRRMRLSPVDALTAAYAAAYASFALAGAPWHWDFWAIWGLKARTFFEHGGIDFAFLRAPAHAFAHPDYPQLVPLNLAFPAIVSGAWDDRWLGAIFVAFAIAAALIARDLAASELPPHAAACAGLAVLALTASRYVGLAEAPLIAFGTAGLLFARRALAGDRSSRWPAAILLGLAASTKNEGLTLVFAAVVAMLVGERRVSWRQRLSSAMVLVAVAGAIVAPWLLARAASDLPVEIAAPGAMARAADRISAPLDLTTRLLERIGKPWLWAAILVALFFSARRERFLTVAVLVQLACFLAAYLVTPYDANWHITTSWGRLSQQLLAPAAYASLTALAVHFIKESAHAEAGSPN